MRGDLFAVEAPVFYKNLIRSRTGDDDAGKIDSRDVALERASVTDGADVLWRAASARFDANSQIAKE